MSALPQHMKATKEEEQEEEEEEEVVVVEEEEPAGHLLWPRGMSERERERERSVLPQQHRQGLAKVKGVCACE
jgi:hypothetical protein